MSVWIINGRCEDCLNAELDGPGDDSFSCGCWCHDICPGCGLVECDGLCSEGEDGPW